MLVMSYLRKRRFSFFIFLALFIFFLRFLSQITLVGEEKPIVFYSNQTQDDLRGLFQKSILSAKEHILLVVYGLSDPFVIEALKNKAKEGVRVHVMVDPKASRGIKRKLGKRIRVDYIYSEGIMHHKWLVVDHEKVYLGSANMTEASLRMHGNLVVGFFSPPLAKRLYRRADEMLRLKPVSFKKKKSYIINDQEVEMWVLPHNEKAYQRLEKLIQSAKKSIKVAMFTWTHKKLANLLVEKSKEINVQVVLDYKSSKGVSKRVFELLKDSNVEVTTSRSKGLLHHKFMVIDDSYLINGSLNWTRSAFTRNHDSFMILNSLNNQQIRKLHKLWHVIKSESR